MLCIARGGLAGEGMVLVFFLSYRLVLADGRNQGYFPGHLAFCWAEICNVVAIQREEP